MAYTHIQCIGYQVPTVAKIGPVFNTRQNGTWTIPSDNNGKAVEIATREYMSKQRPVYTLKGDDKKRVMKNI